MVSTRADRLRMLGLTENDYDELLWCQNGVCAICDQPPSINRRLAVDHCHKTSIIRGLLCTKCNVGLGFFNDDIGRLARAISYLSSTDSSRTGDKRTYGTTKRT